MRLTNQIQGKPAQRTSYKRYIKCPVVPELGFRHHLLRTVFNNLYAIITGASFGAGIVIERTSPTK